MKRSGWYMIGFIAFLLVLFSAKFFLQRPNTPPVPTPYPTSVITVLPTVSVSPRPTSQYEGGTCCTSDQKAKGWVCVSAMCVGNPYPANGTKVQECVAPNSYKRYDPCPLKCLSSSVMILTRDGPVNVKDLKIGQLIWTVDRIGQKELQPILKLSIVEVGASHHVMHFVLSDGRALDVSPNHPTSKGTIVGDLKKGEIYDGATILENKLVLYQDKNTYDLLPAGDTGFYYANDILVGSTLK